jgi:hypothetical protein
MFEALEKEIQTAIDKQEGKKLFLLYRIFYLLRQDLDRIVQNIAKDLEQQITLTDE